MWQYRSRYKYYYKYIEQQLEMVGNTCIRRNMRNMHTVSQSVDASHVFV